MLRSAREHYRSQQRTAALAVLAARRARSQPIGRLAALVAGFQVASAEGAVAAAAAMVAEQGLDASTVAVVAPRALAGFTSSGSPMAPLLDRLRQPDVEPFRLDRFVASQVTDTGRQATAAQMAVTPTVQGYTRMLNGPACSRCIILAGQYYHMNEGFKRHPQCDCIHVPTRETIAGDVKLDPVAHFDSLTEAEQDKAFTKAAAELIRNVEDRDERWQAMMRLTNTRWTATASDARLRRMRQMPEQIIAKAGGDREQMLRLLRQHRYIR